MDRGAWRATVHGATKESDTTYWPNNNKGLFYSSCPQGFLGGSDGKESVFNAGDPGWWWRGQCWTVKFERQRTDAFKLLCWKRLLRVHWTARRSNQSILEEISPEYSSDRLILKLNLQYSDLLMGRTDSLDKTLMLEKIESRRRRGQQRIRWLDDITDLMDVSLSKLRELVMDREAMHATVHGVAKGWTVLRD